MKSEPARVLTSGELAEWRKARPNRLVFTPKPPPPPVSPQDDEEGVVVNGDTVVWEKPAPSFIRSGAEAEVYMRLFKRLMDGYQRVADMLVNAPNVRSELTSDQIQGWVRQKAEESTRRVYADIKPVKSDLAVISRNRDG